MANTAIAFGLVFAVLATAYYLANQVKEESTRALLSVLVYVTIVFLCLLAFHAYAIAV